MLYGLISRVEPALGFGWIVDEAGLDWFFVRDSVTAGTLEELSVNERVGFTSEWTAHGPRAAGIHPERLLQVV